MVLTLDEFERRVLGVLMEKALAQPSYYPMTLNAIVVACNQKNNRDPEMNIDEETAWSTLESLRGKNLIARVLPAGASRVDKFKHEARTVFGWEAPQRAVMAELLLRGPQTTGELRTHCARMSPFESPDAVAAVLAALAQRDPPQVAPLPRAAGQAAVRYTHLLYPESERPTIDTGGPSRGVAAVQSGERAAEAARPAPAPASALQADIEALQSELADVHELLADLRRRVERLEGSGG